MVIREVYLGYLKVFLAWQDQLLQAGSVFEEVGTSEGCESCGGVQDRWMVVLRNWQEERQVEVGIVVVKYQEGRSERAAGSFTRWWLCLDRAALSIATRVLSSGSLPRSQYNQDTNPSTTEKASRGYTNRRFQTGAPRDCCRIISIILVLLRRFRGLSHNPP